MTSNQEAMQSSRVAAMSGPRDFSVVERACMQIDLIDSVSSCASRDEIGGYALLRSHLEPMCRAVAEHDGELIKLLGDGMQAGFVRPMDALRCALAFQSMMSAKAMRTELKARVALTYGECVRYWLYDRVDYYAHEIMLAARLAGHGQEAGIYLSSAFRWQPQIKAFLDSESSESKRVQFKGFPDEVTVYRLNTDRVAQLQAA